MTESKLLIWLNDNLPVALKQRLKLFKLEKFEAIIYGSENAKIGSASAVNNLAGISRNGRSIKKKEDRKKKDLKKKKRRQISNTKFTQIAVRQGSYCYWCGIKVIREACIPTANRITKGNRRTIVYLSNGELREEAVATIDHLVRVEDGGNDQLENLVISCYNCNINRDRITIACNRPFARRKLPCHGCGGRFFHPDWGCCSICGAVPRQPNKLTSILIKIKPRILKLFGIKK